MKSLNKASLDVWNEHCKDDSRKKITDRILLLDSSYELNEKEETELRTLLNLERKLLSDSETLTDINKKTIKKFNFYKSKLNNDERLSTIFLERVNVELLEDKTHTEDDITKIFIQMMEEDMDVDGHQKLNDYYETLLENIEDEDDERCDNPNCIYCADITDKEYTKAYGELLKNGYLDSTVKENDKLMELMVYVCRLEDELSKYKNIDCKNDDDKSNDDTINLDDENLKK